MKRILCLRLPNWSIARLRAARRELEGRPVALFAREARGGESIAACCPAARRRGVRVGMPRAEAAALGSRRDERPLHLEPYDPAADRTALEELAAWCERLSPLVGLENADPPRCLLLDITGLAPLFGSEAAIVRKAQQGFAQLGYSVVAVVADTVGAAWGLAWYGEQRGVIGEGCSCKLEDLPVAALRLLPETLALLYELGLERVGQLWALPRAALAARFGGSGEERLLRRLDQLAGLTPEIIRPHRPPPAWEVAWPLEHPTARREVLEAVLERLLGILAQQWGDQQREVVRLECRLALAAPPSVVLVVGLYEPTAAASHLLELLRLQLDRLSLPGPVHNVSLHATETTSCAERQLELFPDPSRNDARQLAWLLDRLGSRLGVEAVARGQPRGDALPERAFQYLLAANSASRPAPRVGRDKKRTPSTSNAPRLPELGALHRPLWLSAPRPIEVVAIAPDGPPLRFLVEGALFTIARHWGPERIESGWWRGQSVRRDYYRVETTGGERYWLFRRLSDGAWRLHGAFA